MKNLLFALLAVSFISAARCEELNDILYPTQEDASFIITAPASWKMTQAEGEGDYFHLSGPTGAIFSFRTIAGSEDAMGDAIKNSLGMINDRFKDVELGDAQDWTPNGLKGFYAVGTGTEKDGGAKIKVGVGWAALEDGKIAEFWFVADEDDEKGISAAEKIANSLKAP